MRDMNIIIPSFLPGTTQTSPTKATSGISNGQRQRASTACLQCRRLKSRCKRGPDPTKPCERCTSLGTECEVVKSRRGRVLGSRNKRTGLEKSLAHVQAALDRIREEADQFKTTGAPNLPGGPETKPAPPPPAVMPNLAGLKRRHSESEIDDEGDDDEGNSSPASSKRQMLDSDQAMEGDYDDIDDAPVLAVDELPLESTRPSPEPELPKKEETDHPLGLLSNVGSALRLSGGTLPETPSFQITPDSGIDVASSTGVPTDGQRQVLPGWTRAQLQRAANTRSAYFRHRPGAVKRDVSPLLDPITRRFVTEERAEWLLQQWHVHWEPQMGSLDPKIYTLAAMRSRSALLTTVVLATVAMMTEFPGSKELALVLYKHAQSLVVTIVSRNAKSTEIVKALMILSLFPRCPERLVDDRARTLISFAVNMALDLGLNRERPCHEQDEISQRWHRDKLRAWYAVIIQDRSMAAFSGKPTMIKTDVDMAEMMRWLDSPYASQTDRMLIGYIELRLIERDARERLAKATRPYMVDSIRLSAEVMLDGWVRTWVTPQMMAETPLSGNAMRFLAHHVHLLITTASDAPKSELLEIARSSIEFTYAEIGPELRYICRTIIGMITWSAVLLMRLAPEENSNLVRDLALLMAPYGDGRFETYPQFYGSFLLSLVFDTPALSPTSTTFSAPPSARPSIARQPGYTMNHPYDPKHPEAMAMPMGMPPGSAPGMPMPMGVDTSPMTASSGHMVTRPSSGQQAPMWGEMGGDTLQLQMLLGLENSTGLELPWDVPPHATTSNDPGVVVSPPLEWLFNDASGVPNGMEGSHMPGGPMGTDEVLWGYGLEWGGNRVGAEQGGWPGPGAQGY